jgi:hypothetical protein
LPAVCGKDGGILLQQNLCNHRHTPFIPKWDAGCWDLFCHRGQRTDIRYGWNDPNFLSLRGLVDINGLVVPSSYLAILGSYVPPLHCKLQSQSRALIITEQELRKLY